MKTYLIKLIRNIHNFPKKKFKCALKNRKMKISIVLALMISTFILSPIVAINSVNAQPKFPKATELKYVNDYAKVIDNNSAQYILSVGKELEAKTGAQAAVVVVDSLQGEPIESYANGMFRNWGIGQKGKNNGLLILLSMKEKQWRVEVGTGLEGAVTDIYSSRVMNELAVPKFKQKLYGEGLRAAYSSLADNIAKEYNVKLEKNVNVPQVTQNEKSSNVSSKGSGILVIGFIGFIFLDFIFNRGRITKFLLTLLFWSSIGRRGGGNGGGFGGSGGGSGGFGGGSSSGGGSSGGF